MYNGKGDFTCFLSSSWVSSGYMSSNKFKSSSILDPNTEWLSLPSNFRRVSNKWSKCGGWLWEAMVMWAGKNAAQGAGCSSGDPSLVPSTHDRQLRTVCSSSSRESSTFFWSLRASTDMYMYININKSFKEILSMPHQNGCLSKCDWRV